MKLKNILFCAIVIVLFSPVLKAQYEMPKLSDVEEVKNRQPIVIVNPPRPGYVDFYNKKGKTTEAEVYKQVIKDYNDNMKAAVDKFWDFSKKEVLYKTRAELDAMFADKSVQDKYYLIYCYSYYFNYNKDFDWGMIDGGNTVQGSKTLFAIGLPNKKPFFEIWFNDLVPTPILLMHYVATTNFFFKYILANKTQPDLKDFAEANSDMLSKKTLLLSQEQVSPTVVNDIPSYYPCKYRIVSDEELLKTVLAADSSCAYVATGVYGSKQAINWIINCKDGAPIGYNYKEAMGVSFTTDQGFRKDFFGDLGKFCKDLKK
ncbi:MAG TPA: hypothetical protein VK809_06155 [Bacteroidia bacterium]|jgi:hypothetical protein|nr:hypothetical protein [Bacteroidia bacterium]